ncbi:SRPBCC domain-containing protein [Gramella sp. MAR_2010_147]|uniref:SRPBCC family protein n=1 Tax=Gramella sp. MAR_2010_147 TaxID=1250205 RepID=UPI00087A2CF7|nr:SRPBCC domain-containing protein [Gramella sp. MAR_2010_147]SDS05652.1 Uncharacterized conserved protein YndB, AHSA1/START domain [Gramella sp. MAR_2010_147]
MEIKHNLTIKTSPETIFKAVSTEKGITGWWCKDAKVGEAEGEKSLLKFNKQGTIVPMGFETIRLDSNKKVVWECIDNPNPAWIGTKLTTEISKTEDGAEVIFSHSEFDEKWKGQEPFEMTKQGWRHFMDSLVSYCEIGEGQAW